MKKVIIFVSIIFLTQACKKVFTPALSNSDDNKFLVIEGVISANDSTTIKLSRTKKVDTLRTIFPENNAQVSVESDAGSSHALAQTKAGTYAVAPLNIDGSHKYRLRIVTTDGKIYLSDFVAFKSAPPIDSVGFVARSSGVQIYVNSHDDANSSRYYRWEYTEAWQFHSQYNSAYYSNGKDSIKARLVSQQIYSCYSSDTSTSVGLASTINLAKDVVFQAPITAIAGNSEKIESKYSILVKQYALTSDAYAFWENLQKNTEKLGSIFDVLPSQSQSNYHCISNPAELVVGFLSAGNVSYKRIFISAGQLLPGFKPVYPEVCELDTAFENPNPGILTQKSIAILVPFTSPYVPVSGLYLPPPNINGAPTAYTFSTRKCVDCTIRGSTKAPVFWK